MKTVCFPGQAFLCLPAPMVTQNQMEMESFQIQSDYKIFKVMKINQLKKILQDYFIALFWKKKKSKRVQKSI